MFQLPIEPIHRIHLHAEIGIMGGAVVALTTLEELTTFVHRTLCQPDALVPEQTPIFRTIMKRAGQPTGVLFHIEGPRLLRTSAVWSADDHRIFFYDSTGQRVRAVRLSESPEIADAFTPRASKAA